MCARVGRCCEYSRNIGASILGFAPRIVPLGWPGLTDERRRERSDKLESRVSKSRDENKERGWRRADSEGKLSEGKKFQMLSIFSENRKRKNISARRRPSWGEDSFLSPNSAPASRTAQMGSV